MKKWNRMGCVTILLLVWLGLTACGAKQPAALTLDKDFGIEVGGTWFPIYQDVEPLLFTLGGDYKLFAAPSCLFVGEDKEFEYRDCSVFTNPVEEIDLWYLIKLKTGAFKTARGVAVGSSMDELTAAYGQAHYWESDDQMAYSISGIQGDLASPCLLFSIEDETIREIEIYYPTNMN
ncbi:MAG: hypothetical protein GX809_04720 [Clostridiaceae bacterium]|nr:hypothetical protein [Clostridiaceae bacterium]